MPGKPQRCGRPTGSLHFSGGGPADDLARTFLLDAALAQQRRDWTTGRRLPVAEWLRQYPALASDPARAGELVYHEYALRQEVGESPSGTTICGSSPSSG